MEIFKVHFFPYYKCTLLEITFFILKITLISKHNKLQKGKNKVKMTTSSNMQI